jgi:hypothetical protein
MKAEDYWAAPNATNYFALSQWQRYRVFRCDHRKGLSGPVIVADVFRWRWWRHGWLWGWLAHQNGTQFGLGKIRLEWWWE